MKDLRARLGKTGDPMFTPHKLRHTCASRMVSKGIQLAVVQKWMVHTVIATTMKYAHLADDALDRARERMERA